MYRSLLFAAALVFAPAGIVLAQTETTQNAPAAGTPQEFAMMAAQSNMLEIESSKLALEKSKDATVQAFAQKMIDDHTKAGQEMKAAASADNVSDVPAKLDADHQAKLDELKNATADNFDSAYGQMQREAHEQAVQLFSQYSRQKGALADFAGKTLPALQGHLEMAKALPGTA